MGKRMQCVSQLSVTVVDTWDDLEERMVLAYNFQRFQPLVGLIVFGPVATQHVMVRSVM